MLSNSSLHSCINAEADALLPTRVAVILRDMAAKLRMAFNNAQIDLFYALSLSISLCLSISLSVCLCEPPMKHFD